MPMGQMGTPLGEICMSESVLVFFLETVIKIDEGFHMLVLKRLINGFDIVSGIK
ncbi:hypothetical protein [Paenibacillus sp. N3.4]|uniref:hypothetical protein n=1 Tax=Paenibacillus sp. N3.4 TaxID=2603222 RepID=UPI001C9D467D|nr:hypothetical protein [Paenibacillus sp. N3.4]